MNIFYIDPLPKICAQYHVDSHVIKQILEYAQILSTTHRVLDGVEYIDNSSGRKIKRWKLPDERENYLYKSTHWNHPSVVWTRQSRNNYAYLHELFIELLAEYNHRYYKGHACSKLLEYFHIPPANIPTNYFTEPTPAMDEKYIVPNDSLQSYRNYYKYGKIHLHSWKNRPVPDWILN